MAEAIKISAQMAAAREQSIKDAVEKDRKKLLQFIKKRVATTEDAEDILQDVFYQFSQSIEPIEQVTAWLYRVTRNKIIDWYRKKKPVSIEDQKLLRNDDEEPLMLQDMLFDPNENTDEVYARSLLWTQLAEALDELPEEQREVFILHELEDISFKEIAERTGVSVNTLLSRKRYAVLHLRERLRDMYDELVK